MKPEELLYAKTHEWTYVSVENGHKMATIGISSFAVEQLNDLVYMELPVVGRKIKSGDSLGEIESVKAVSDIYSPVSGEITAVNADLPDSLDILKDNPYDNGWMVKIKMTDDSELSGLMDHAAYIKQCAEEG